MRARPGPKNGDSGKVHQELISQTLLHTRAFASRRPVSGHQRAPYPRAFSGSPVTSDAGTKLSTHNKTIAPKEVGRSKPKRRYPPSKQLTEQAPRNIEEEVRRSEQLPAALATPHEYTFGQRLRDAQRVEDLFELVRDAERLTPTEVACLPITLMQLYQKRSTRDQQAVTTHLFFEGIAKPWALEPAKLNTQEQLAVLSCLLEVDSWNPGAGPGLTACITAVGRACTNSLELASHTFSPAQLLQILTICNDKATVRKASPQLASASLTACARHLESLTPDDIAQAVFLSAQNKLRLNVKLPDIVRQLVLVGVARASAMSALELSQFLFGAAAVKGLKQAQLQKLVAVATVQAPHFKAPALKNVFWFLGTTKVFDQGLLSVLEEQLFQQSPHLTSSHVATAMWAFGRLTYMPNISLAQELSNQAMLKTSTFTAMQTRLLLWGCYTLRFVPPDALLEALAKRLTPALPHMKTRDISGIIWALGGLHYEPSNMQLLLQAAQEQAWQMNSHDISQCLRGMANLRLASQGVVHTLAGQAYNILDTFHMQGLANLAWSMAHLDFKNEGLLDAIIRLAVNEVEDINPRDITELLSALAILVHAPPDQDMDLLIQHMTVLLSETESPWEIQDLSTSIWALAKLNIGNRKILDLIYNRVLVNVPILSGKDISYQMWGFAMLGYPLQRAVVTAYLGRLHQVRNELDPVDLSHILWALMYFNSYPDAQALDALLATLPPQLSNAEPAVVATIAHACGELRHCPSPTLLDSLEQHMVQHSRQCSCADWSAVLQAFTRLQARTNHLYPALLQEVQAGTLEMDSKLLGDCMWSFALFQAWKEPLYQYLIHIRRQLPLAAFKPRSLRQICQAWVIAQADGYAPDLPEDFKIRAQEHWLRSQLPFNATPLVQELCQALDALQLQHQQGIALTDGLLRVDIALPEQRIAIEALGPLKTLRNRDELTGRAAYRQHLLRALGWTVVQINKSQWDALSSDEEKQRYLASLLSAYV